MADILALCKITVPEVPTEEWQTAKLRFLGAEHYELGTKSIEVQFGTHDGGMTFKLREPLYVRADKLLGTKCEAAMLIDVELIVGGLTLSLASLRGGTYPRALRRGESVKIL